MADDYKDEARIELARRELARREQSKLQKPISATPQDKSQAFNQIKGQFPGMSDFLIQALLPAATKLAESPQDNGEGTATGAFLRSAARTPLEGAENLASLIGLPTVKNGQYPIVGETLSDREHPFAEGSGALAGMLAPGASSVAALRSIPLWGNIIRNSAPSILQKALTRGMEGAALGAGFSPEDERGKGALIGGSLGGIASLLPIITKFPAVKKLNMVRKNLQKHGITKLDIPEYILNDIEQNKYLRNNQANRNLLANAKTGDEPSLFNLQSDLAGLQRRYGNDWFSSAQRELGRDIGNTRQDLLNNMRFDIGYKGRPQDAELMRLGQQQYRQHMKLMPWRNRLIIGALAGIPGYHYLKKFIP